MAGRSAREQCRCPCAPRHDLPRGAHKGRGAGGAFKDAARRGWCQEAPGAPRGSRAAGGRERTLAGSPAPPARRPALAPAGRRAPRRGGEGPELGAERGPGRFRALRPGGPGTRNAAGVGGPPGAARGRVAAPSPADRRPECGRKRLARGAPARGPQPLPERRKEPARGAEIRSRSSLINFLFNVTGPHCGRGNTSPRP